MGRVIDLDSSDSDRDQARAQVERMCEQLLANPLIESYEIELARVTSPQPRIGVLRFPGACDDRDALWALAALDAEAVFVWHTETELPGLDAVVLPGGFSYGDYLRCGAIARFAPAMEAVAAFAGEGGLVLGICNGFQILCEAGLLPGVLRRNESLSFVCRDVPLVVERTDTPFTSRCAEGERLTIPVKHGEGCWFADDALVRRARGEPPDRASLRGAGQRFSE